MKIGIIGADDRGVAIGRLLLRSGHKVTFSDPTGRGAAHNAELALDHWATESTPGQQAQDCQAVILAVHWQDVNKALDQLGEYRDGILIDTTIPPQDDGQSTSGAERIAARTGNAHVVKGFVDVSDPLEPIEIASDDTKARLRVAEIIMQSGAHVTDMGPLACAIEIERAYVSKHTYP